MFISNKDKKGIEATLAGINRELREIRVRLADLDPINVGAQLTQIIADIGTLMVTVTDMDLRLNTIENVALSAQALEDFEYRMQKLESYIYRLQLRPRRKSKKIVKTRPIEEIGVEMGVEV